MTNTIRKTALRGVALAAALAAIVAAPRSASAQTPTPAPDRDKTWGGVTDALVLTSLGTQLLFPRVYYPHAETTEGWKARWHVSVLAPIMTISTLALVNEQWFKDSVESHRPGCDPTNQGGPNCTSFGGPSTHAFAAASAFGYGGALFLFDTMKWSHGRINAPGLVANVAVPFVLGAVTIAGRSAGDYEDAGQLTAGATVGLGFGFLTGMTYALFQRPECGYGAGLICW